MKNNRLFALLAAVVALIAAPAAAQDGKAIELSGYVKEVRGVAEDGAEPKTELIEPDNIVPGDQLLFVTGFKNVSDELVENFVITKPINPALRLVAGEYGDAVVSVDGGESYGQLSEMTVESDDGLSRPATESDITHLRWTLAKIDVGASGEIKFNAIVR